MAARKPTTIKAATLLQTPTKATQEDLVRALAELTTQFQAVLAQLDSDPGVGTFVTQFTPSPRIIL